MTYFTRADWGAATPTRTLTRLNPRDVTHFVVHFDGSSPLGLRDPKALLRAFQRFHQGTRGWADIAYNSLVFQGGDSAEGRGAYVGGHLRGAQNARAWGCMAAIGNGERPTEALWVALAEEYERACKWAGKTLIVSGHTNWPDANKSCPGSYLLGGIRAGRIQRIPARPAPIPTVPKEDIMATTDELRQIIREELHALLTEPTGMDWSRPAQGDSILSAVQGVLHMRDVPAALTPETENSPRLDVRVRAIEDKLDRLLAQRDGLRDAMGV